MTYKCPKCGNACSSEQEATFHCAKVSNTKCPECGGSGKKANWLAPNETCPRCKGSGVV